MARGNTSVRSDILTYVGLAREQGLSMTEIAGKLGVNRSTLYRWRDGRTTPSKRVKRRMNRGGKLTQLIQNARPDGEEVDGDVESTTTDALIPGPQFASTAIEEMAGGELIDLSGREEPLEVEAIVREVEIGGQTEWRIGPNADTLGEVRQEYRNTFTIGSPQDERDLAGYIRQWLVEEGLYPDIWGYAPQSGTRRVT